MKNISTKPLEVTKMSYFKFYKKHHYMLDGIVFLDLSEDTATEFIKISALLKEVAGVDTLEDLFMDAVEVTHKDGRRHLAFVFNESNDQLYSRALPLAKWQVKTINDHCCTTIWLRDYLFSPDSTDEDNDYILHDAIGAQMFVCPSIRLWTMYNNLSDEQRESRYHSLGKGNKAILFSTLQFRHLYKDIAKTMVIPEKLEKDLGKLRKLYRPWLLGGDE